MALDEENSVDPEEAMPGMSPADSLTYDPTQGPGTSAWQASVRASMELNAQERRN